MLPLRVACLRAAASAMEPESRSSLPVCERSRRPARRTGTSSSRSRAELSAMLKPRGWQLEKRSVRARAPGDPGLVRRAGAMRILRVGAAVPTRKRAALRPESLLPPFAAAQRGRIRRGTASSDSRFTPERSVKTPCRCLLTYGRRCEGERSVDRDAGHYSLHDQVSRERTAAPATGAPVRWEPAAGSLEFLRRRSRVRHRSIHRACCVRSSVSVRERAYDAGYVAGWVVERTARS